MRNMKALVVDDSKVGRLTMQKKLEAFGVGVDLAESGVEALNYLERHRPDMIFMDHMMPDLDGFEATRRIKAAPATRNIPVIIISGSDDEAFVRDARAIGALDAIVKPPANDAIERILGSLPQTAATSAGEEAPPPARPRVPTATTAQLDQAELEVLIKANIGEAIEKMRGEWLHEFRTRLEAEFENERQLQRTWTSRLEQRLDQTTAGLADLARVAAESEAQRQRLHTLETRLHALESPAVSTTTPNEAWLEAVDQRVGPSLAGLGERAEYLAARLGELRQELLQGMDDRHAQSGQTIRDLAARVEALSEAVQERVATTQSWEDSLSKRLDTIEQRLANLEAAATQPAMDQALLPTSLEANLSGQLSDMLRERHEPLEAELDRLRGQLQAVGQSQEALQSALSAQGEELGALMEQRLAQMRAELDAALQSAASGQETAPEVALVGARVESAAVEPKPMMAEPVTDAAAAVEQDQQARLAQRLADEWNVHWQAQLERLQGKVKTLTLVTAAGAVALLATLIVLAM